MGAIKLLGAVLAGGRARRFGSDKALALLNGQPLLSHVVAALSAQTQAIVVCGHEWTDGVALADRPRGNLGPLGGLNAALHHALAKGFDAVLTAGCDTPILPTDLASQLTKEPGSAIVETMPIIGCWPVALAPALDAHLNGSGDRSVRRWAQTIGARFIVVDFDIANINTPGDLTAIDATGNMGRFPESR